MKNCMFAYPDHIINPYTELSGGYWHSSGQGMSLTSLQDSSDLRMSSVARSVDTQFSSTQFQGTFSEGRDLRFFAICGHNASRNATVRLQLFSTNYFVDTLLDTGYVPMWPQFYTPDSLEWEHPSFWTGIITDEECDGYKPDFYLAFDALSQSVLSFKVFIQDPGNDDSFFQLSRCILASAWQPKINIDFGSGVQWNDPSTVSKSLGSVKFYNKRRKYRSITGKFSAMSQSFGADIWLEMQRRLGISGELFFVYDPSDVYQSMKQRSFLCAFRELSALENPYIDNNTAAFTLEEVI